MDLKEILLGTSPLFILLASCLLALRFIWKLYSARRAMINFQKQGLSMPPHHSIFGHLLLTNKVVSTLPSDVHGHYLPDLFRRMLPDLGPVYYLDNWPFSPPILLVNSPEAAYQIAQEHSLPKFHGLREYLRPLTGEHDLVTMEGPLWKTWRGIFNPGFSASHIQSLVPSIVKETDILCEILDSHAEKQHLFLLKKATENLTMDVIGRVVLDTSLNSQRSDDNKLVSALRRQVPWCTFGIELNPLKKYHPLRPLIHWYNTRQMNQYIFQELENRFASLSNNHTTEATKRSKSVIDLALEGYLADNSAKSDQETPKGMDATFKAFATSQIKLFLFSGHDTTSSTICYIFHLLSSHSPAVQRLRAEYNNIFGPKLPTSDLATLISDEPHLLNQLPFTTAVIKETLRLFPPVSNTRAGEPNFSVTDANGRKYPTDGCLVWCIHQAMHRDPAYWPVPNTFLPDRWLVPHDHPLHPIKGAWRGFEHGPRNCLGQELAMMEMKVVMVMVLRRFDVRSAYDEWDRSGARKGRKGKGPKSVSGERAYQVVLGGAQPSDHMPCRVERYEA